MAFICDLCYKAGDKTLAPFVVEDVSVQRTTECCEKHIAAELLRQLQRAGQVIVRRGEIEDSTPPPAFPA